MHDLFRKFASIVSKITGSAWTFASAVLLILVWILTGPMFDYSDTWQLFINTLTTIITFLMVFLIQNTQNRDGRAVHLKLDELIRAQSTARNSMLDVENISDEALEELQAEYRKLYEKHLKELEKRGKRK